MRVSGRSKWTSFLAILIIGVSLAIIGSTPPLPKSVSAPMDEFSSGRAMKDVRIIASRPHPTGSKENEIVREYLIRRMSELGLTVSISESEISGRDLDRLNRWSGETKSSQTIYNLVGVLHSKDPSRKALLLMAHHDTVWGSPGASDDTIGIATILETMRILSAMENRKRDVIVLFTDAEELGLSGARQFFANHPLRDKVGAVINFEARGGGGLATIFQTSRRNGDAARLYAQSVRKPSTSSLSVFVYNALPNDTDLTPALERDYTAYNIAHIGRAGYYHSPKITAEALDEKSLQHMGSQALDLARALIQSETLPEKKPDAVFFDVFGFFTVIYAPVLGWAILLVGGIFYGFSVRSAFNAKAFAAGSAKMLILMVMGGALLFAFNVLSGAGKSANYYDRLAAIPKLESLVTFVCLAVLLMVFGSKTYAPSHRFGMSVPLFILAIVGQFYAPTAIYVLSLSLLFCGVASWVASFKRPTFISCSMGILCSALVVGYMVMLGHLLMLGVGPDFPSVAILPCALIGLALAPTFRGFDKPTVRWTVIGCISVSLALALWVRFDPIASTVPVY